MKPHNQEPAAWEVVYEFDPASPNWWERVKRLPSSLRLPNLPAAPVSSGESTTREHLDRTWVELPPRAWQAYPLSVDAPGQPHLLEIEYPSDLPQTLAISIVEPNPAGHVGPFGVDSGIDVLPPGPGHQPGTLRHRLVFWPQTATPVALLVNRREEGPAFYGSVRLKAGPLELPPLEIPLPRHPTAHLAASFEKPLFVENFSATEALDPATGRSLDDWLTFLTSRQRLVETLRHTGRNAAVVSVVCEGSALYPSQLLQPTPRYDSGVFFESGQDPLRKDVLELLFRLFDRAGIQLVPAVQFTAPLPELEALRSTTSRGHRPGTRRTDGRTWLSRNGSRRGMGVYYNPLDQRVQQAMADVVRELAERYGHHPSFGGVAVQHSPEAYSLLPDGVAATTMPPGPAFAAAKQIELPESRESPLATRRLLRSTAEEDWLTWRTERIAELYTRMQSEVTRNRASARLYLTTGELLAGRQMESVLRPTLPEQNNAGPVLRMLGFDAQQLAAQGMVALPVPNGLCRPLLPRTISTAIGTRRSSSTRSSSVASATSLSTSSRASSAAIAAVRNLPFSPFGTNKTRLLLISQIQPTDAECRRRFVQSLAQLDAPLMIDGGWMLPLGRKGHRIAREGLSPPAIRPLYARQANRQCG